MAHQNQQFHHKKYVFSQKIGKNIEHIQIFSISDFRQADFLLQYAILETLYRQKNNGNFGLSEGLLNELFRFVTDGKNSF